MKRVRIVLALLLAAGTAAAAILLPPAISNAQDRLAFGVVQTEAYEAPAVQTEASVEEKLALLCMEKTAEGSDGFISSRQESLGTRKSIQAQVFSELEKLLKLGALPPDIRLDESCWKDENSILLSYTGLVGRPVSLRVWNSTFINREANCYLTTKSDADTGMIYDYSFNFDSSQEPAYVLAEEDAIADFLEKAPGAFGDYLGITLTPFAASISDSTPVPDSSPTPYLPSVRYYTTEDKAIGYLFFYDETGHFQGSLFSVEAFSAVASVDMTGLMHF